MKAAEIKGPGNAPRFDHAPLKGQQPPARPCQWDAAPVESNRCSDERVGKDAYTPSKWRESLQSR